MRKSRTPLQHYEMLRQKLVTKFSNEEVWGNSVSGKRLRNLCDLMEFLEMSEELANLDDEVEETIFEENVKLLLGKSIPLPRILRESMLGFKPVQSFAEKYIQLRESLRFESTSLANHLREISASAKAGGFTQFSFEEGLANSNDERDRVGYYDTDFSEKPPEYNCEDKENFAAKLRWIRWKIYQKIEHKIATSNDVEKYEELVHKFVSKFNGTQLSGWEVSIWLNKALQTKRDVHEGIFRSNSDASEVHSQVSSQESLSDEDDNEPEVTFVSKFFDKATAYENLCSNLPNVPELEDPDDQIEKRLWRLKERDNDDDFETGYDMFGKHKHEETESKINHLEVKDTKSDKKDVDVFDDKTEAMGKIKNPESFNDSVQTKESVPNNINAFDTNKEEFNNWYESQLKMKERKSYVRVLSEEPPLWSTTCSTSSCSPPQVTAMSRMVIRLQI